MKIKREIARALCTLFGHKYVERTHPRAYSHQKRRVVCLHCGKVIYVEKIKKAAL